MTDRQKLSRKKQETDEPHRAMQLLLRTSMYFAIPAFLAAFLGKWLDARYETGRIISLGSLGIGFVLSWALVALDYHITIAKKRTISTVSESETLDV